MDKREAERMLSTLRGELAAAEKRVGALNKVIDGIMELYPELDPSLIAGADKPKTQDAIRQVMVESPGKWFTIKLMVGELERRGWLPESSADPSSAVRTALSRLAETDQHVKKGTGEKTKSITYSYRRESSNGVEPAPGPPAVRSADYEEATP